MNSTNQNISTTNLDHAYRNEYYDRYKWNSSSFDKFTSTGTQILNDLSEKYDPGLEIIPSDKISNPLAELINDCNDE